MNRALGIKLPSSFAGSWRRCGRERQK